MTIRVAIGLVILFLVMPTGTNAQDPVRSDWRVDKRSTSVDVTLHQKPFFTYRFGEVTYKPYLEKLHTPRGVNILRDSPADHVHHHGLMFALGVDGVDFWTEAPESQPGRQIDRGWEITVGDFPDKWSAAELCQKLDWIAGSDQQKRHLLSETRTIRAFTGPGLDAALLTWHSELAAATGRESIALGGSHYFGLGMRFVHSMDRDSQFIFAAGDPGGIIRGKERVTASKWVAIRGKAGDGHPVTVALFDHPDNPRYPAAMFTMPEPFAYMSATLELFRRPLTLEAGRPLVLRYGAALWDGEADRPVIESTYTQWLKIEAAGRQSP